MDNEAEGLVSIKMSDGSYRHHISCFFIRISDVEMETEAITRGEDII